MATDSKPAQKVLEELKEAVAVLIERTTVSTQQSHQIMRHRAMDAARWATLIASAGNPHELLERSVKFKELVASEFQLYLNVQTDVGYLTALIKVMQLLS